MADPRNLLGSGMAGHAADDLRLSAIYRRELSDGKEMPPYEEWKKQYNDQSDADMKAGYDAVARK